MNRDRFILYHFPWLSAATLRYTEALLLKAVHLVPPVLDLGCGDGAFAYFTFDRRLEIGLDLTINGSPYLSKAYRTVIEGSITDIPLEDSSVRTVISNCVMEHVDDLQRGLREIHRVLRSGGEFALTVPSACSKYMSFVARLPLLRSMAQRKWMDWYNGRLHIVNFMTPTQWQAVLGQSGFDIVESQAYVQRPAMFWHTLFATSVLLGMQLFPQLRGRKSDRQTRMTDRSAPGLWIGRLWFWMLGKGYISPVTRLSEGGYVFIRCRKR